MAERIEIIIKINGNPSLATIDRDTTVSNVHNFASSFETSQVTITLLTLTHPGVHEIQIGSCVVIK